MKRAIFCIVFLFIAFSSYSIRIEPDSTLNEIRTNTELTAENTEKGNYETVTLIVAILALITAGVTLAYSYKTYKSQKQTQENTAPKITEKNQYETLLKTAMELIHTYIEAYAIRIILEKTKKHHVFEIYLISKKLNPEEIHLELFYDNTSTYLDFMSVQSFIDKNQSKYSCMYNLKNDICHFNNYIDIVSKHLGDKTYDKDACFDEIENFIINKSYQLIIRLIKAVDKIYQEENIRKEIVRYIIMLGSLGLLFGDNNYNSLLKIHEKNPDYKRIISDISLPFHWNEIFKDSAFPYTYDNKDIDEKSFLNYLTFAILNQISNYNTLIQSPDSATD